MPLKLIVIPSSINFHLEINNPEETSKLETEFAEEVKKRGEDFKYFKDQFGEHPEERANNEEISEKLAGVTTLNEIYAAIKDKVGFAKICFPYQEDVSQYIGIYSSFMFLLLSVGIICRLHKRRQYKVESTVRKVRILPRASAEPSFL